MTIRDSLPTQWHSRHPASQEIIAEISGAFPWSLPSEYLDFLKTTNGGEGEIGSIYLVLWPTEDLVKLNNGYNIESALPGVLAVGDDGANIYGFQFSLDGSYEVIRFPFGYCVPEGIDVRLPSLEVLISKLTSEELH